jgi:hypothetical protein
VDAGRVAQGEDIVNAHIVRHSLTALLPAASSVIGAVSLCCVALTLASCGGDGSGNAGSSNSGSGGNPASANVQHILFVGDSFTHGRYTPVRPYNSGGTESQANGSPLVVDENYGQTGARAELEPGPWGGIPGIFAELAVEARLSYDVHIEAISETSLAKNFAAASSVIVQPKWNAVVLQELSAKPLPGALTNNSDISDPAGFCSSVQTIEQAVHGSAANAKVYLYETWARGDLAETLAGGDPTASEFPASYLSDLTRLTDANHNAYYSAAKHDGAIAAVAPAGEAWQLAWNQGNANPDPFVTSAQSGLPSLWYGINAVNDPQIASPDYMHPSIYGAYLSGLVLFQQITGVDARTMGSAETAAAQLGIPAAVAVQLQQIAWQAVTQENSAPVNQTVDPCTVSK